MAGIVMEGDTSVMAGIVMEGYLCNGGDSNGGVPL